MNWSVLPIFITVGLAQAGLVVALVDRLFKAEIRLLSEAIKELREEMKKRDYEIRDLRDRVTRLEEWRSTQSQ